MKQDIKEKWVNALRSGEYEQGRGCLRNVKNEYCCLGVLCDLYSKDHIEEEFWFHGEIDKYTFMDVRNYLPIDVQLWAGLDSKDPFVSFPGMGSRSIAYFNDFYLDFEILANLIEEQL